MQGDFAGGLFVWVVFTHNALCGSPLPAFSPLEFSQGAGFYTD